MFHIKSAAHGPVLTGEYTALKLLICQRPPYCPEVQSTGKTKCTISPRIGLSHVLIPCLNVKGSVGQTVG